MDPDASGDADGASGAPSPSIGSRVASLARTGVRSVYRARSSALLDEPVPDRAVVMASAAVAHSSARLDEPVPEGLEAPLQPHASVRGRAVIVASAAVVATTMVYATTVSAAAAGAATVHVAQCAAMGAAAAGAATVRGAKLLGPLLG